MAQGITFYGAARTVTGSRHLIESNGKKILVDCGMFQGSRELRDRNWQPFPVHPNEIDAVVITHAHMDHIGWLPRLVRQGYRGPIYATKATVELSRISLPDSGRIQEEDALRANKHGSRHQPALPLYDEADAYACLQQFESVPFRTLHALPGGMQWQYLPAGHILGSAFVELYFENGERILMSGDLGRYNRPILEDPTPVDFAEYLVIESTYGDRLHPAEDPLDKLEQIIKEAYASGSAILVPSFAIGRTQELLYDIEQLQSAGRIPIFPIYLDSPMATSTTNLYARAKEEFDEEMRLALKEGHTPLEPRGLNLVRDRHQSIALNSQRGPMMIISGSGMANGGRIVHHLFHRLSDPNTRVLFTGYQAEGTLGRALLDGAPTVHMMHQEIEVAAKVDKLNALSAHADQGEILRWLGNFKQPPKNTFIVHGEAKAQDALKAKIEQELGWPVAIPEHGASFALD